ncbi:hypothetical protein GOV09_05780 [Candidatus Woesearchaeota archaeon]|nr:hypothetical protein [Candidatus Woesearchaeota archaeon]
MPRNLRKDKRFLQIRELLEQLEKDYGISKKEILEISEDILIPVSLYSSGLSSLEIIVKYLKEGKQFSLSTIAKLTGRSKQGVWQSLSHARKKHPKAFVSDASPYDFPVSIISDKKHSVLESIVVHLKEAHSLSYAQIARLLNRDQRTVWTVYNKVKK